jgi:hypothetical protein
MDGCVICSVSSMHLLREVGQTHPGMASGVCIEARGQTLRVRYLYIINRRGEYINNSLEGSTQEVE